MPTHDEVRAALAGVAEGIPELAVAYLYGLAVTGDVGPDSDLAGSDDGGAPSAGLRPPDFDDMPGALLWFARKPRIGAVLDAVERVAC